MRVYDDSEMRGRISFILKSQPLLHVPVSGDDKPGWNGCRNRRWRERYRVRQIVEVLRPTLRDCVRGRYMLDRRGCRCGSTSCSWLNLQCGTRTDATAERLWRALSGTRFGHEISEGNGATNEAKKESAAKPYPTGHALVTTLTLL